MIGRMGDGLCETPHAKCTRTCVCLGAVLIELTQFLFRRSGKNVRTATVRQMRKLSRKFAHVLWAVTSETICQATGETMLNSLLQSRKMLLKGRFSQSRIRVFDFETNSNIFIVFVYFRRKSNKFSTISEYMDCIFYWILYFFRIRARFLRP